ncbi:MAG: 30S ribosomal protein S17 [Legionellales bacterium]|nr:30S ribosomal protein S17 [Legionellales bacterium]
MSELNKQPRIATGVVVSDKNDKTIVVAIERRIKDPLYGKFKRQTRKRHVHDVDNVAKLGDKVRIKESRPHSKLKVWELVEVITEN